jgi:uncharacterized protein (DUF488 family)
MTRGDSGPIFTIGHSIRRIDRFIDLLQLHTIESLVDVRSFPGSRRHPQFNQSALFASLRAAGIAYNHMVTLGGKHKSPDAAKPDIYRKNRPFASYADYTKTLAFRAALIELETLAARTRVGIMCAEADWTQCHRAIIAEELAKDGFAVTHIMSPDHDRAAELSPRLPGF